ncbi:MAG: hypothetical protein IKI84_08345 [Clostridia bacterium]|nr:hypothetical protein [Clostridia bacterium]
MLKRFSALLLTAILLASSAVFTGAGADFDLNDFFPAKSVAVGDYVYFGEYDQDNVSGKEPIQWVVLSVSGNQALLISRYGLECKPFHTNSAGQTWENCSLRTWLNGTFLKTAFSKEERDAIQYTHIDESYSQSSPAFPPARVGNDTNDYVFILSYAEAVKYLTGNRDLMCIPTNHALANGGNRSNQAYLNGNRTCWYWLRSPAYKNNALAVDWNGTFSSGYISQEYGVVRPCIWVDVNKAF